MADKSIIAKANNAFGFNLFQVVQNASPGKNTFLSPFSLSTALAMTYMGARENTKKEMAEVMQWIGEDDDKIHQLYQSYISMIKQASSDFQLSTANRIYMQTGFSVLQEFKDKTRTLYFAEAVSADFKANADAERTKINTWVEQQTQDKIKDLLGPGVLNNDTRMVLVNAIYFKGKWDSPFKERDTFTSPFKVAPGQTVQVKMMSATNLYAVIQDEELKCTVLEIPYKGKSLGMVIILPNEDFGLQTLVKNLTPQRLNDLLQQLKGPRAMDQVQLFLPRFEMCTAFALKPILSNIGMPEAFSTSADFSGMSDDKKGLRLSDVIHKSYMTVNEEGTEAAASTAVVMVPECDMPASLNIECDHPFLFVLQDSSANNMALFLGQVYNPLVKTEQP